MNGKDIIDMGFEPGPHIPAMIDLANSLDNPTREDLKHLAPPPKLKLQHSLPFFSNIRAENDDEADNVAKVSETMREVMETPVVKAGAVMPDACPAGPVGTIPVGGVVASEGIHPGMHSSDVCCSMAISVVPGASPKRLLDAIHKVTHFGPGGRGWGTPSEKLLDAIWKNPFTKDHLEIARSNMATQGDGNHFAYVGTMKSTGETALVTHHGSRGFGARLYKQGMRVAERYRQKLSPATLKQNAWIPADTQEGEDYWDALQIARAWTKENHFILHDAAVEECSAKVADRFWNEHNFVFRKPDGLFYHAKGATPAFDGWANDATKLTIIPLNMSEPILIVRGSNADNGLGFSPHGAGRNYSRTAHRKMQEGTDEEVFERETSGLDARFFMGITDTTELPSAYKDAGAVRAQIGEYALAEIVDEVIPYGCIMAGDWEQEAPWRKRKQ